ncbi:MAG: putative transcriptional regulatory protein [Phycisphaerae bacterium]|nr:putative transcriptional regulatory protein [Phycisphaerae bacterium]
MAGHSHFANIQHKKAKLDAKRGKVWTKVARMIIQAARAGGGDVDGNASLRLAVEKAKDANMPRDTIERAIKKGTGELEGESLEEMIYEGYGPNGVAIMCKILTDNRNRTAPEVKKIFERAGGSLAGPNSVAWMFNQKGLFIIPAVNTTEENLMNIALEAGADDVQNMGNSFEVTCAPDALQNLKNSLQAAGIKFESADLSMVPQNYVVLNDADTAQKVIRLVEALDDHDDVQNVSANFDIPDDIMAKINV